MDENEIKKHNQKWYQKTYSALVDKAKSRGLDKKTLDGYYEKHHILPKCLGGSDSEDNLVLLTYREHIIAHKLLTKIHPEESSLYYSVSLMMCLRILLKNGNYFKIREFSNTREASEYKIQAKKLDRESGKLVIIANNLSKRFKGKRFTILSDSSRDKLSLSLKGKKKSKEHIQNFLKSVENNYPSARKVVDPNGKIFDSVKNCAKYYNTSSTNIIRWIKNSNKDFRYLDNKVTGFRKYKILCPDNTVCNNIKECSERFNRSEKTIRNWIEKFPEKGFKYLSEKSETRNITSNHKQKISAGLKSIKNNPSSKKIQGPDGTIYSSMRECSEKINKDRHTITKWIKEKPEKGFKYYTDNDKNKEN